MAPVGFGLRVFFILVGLFHICLVDLRLCRLVGFIVC